MRWSKVLLSTNITHSLNKNYDNNMISVTLTTDIIGAFDTVDSPILIKKLNSMASEVMN